MIAKILIGELMLRLLWLRLSVARGVCAVTAFYFEFCWYQLKFTLTAIPLCREGGVGKNWQNTNPKFCIRYKSIL